MTDYQTPTTDFADHADALEASCVDLIGEPINELSAAPNDAVRRRPTMIAAADCAQVDAMIAAVELRLDPTQCDFQPHARPEPPSPLR